MDRAANEALFMRRILLISITVFAAARFGAAQLTGPAADVLGAHLNYGRGCAACHAPHSGAAGNGMAKSASPSLGTTPLWDADAGGMYGKTIATGGGKFVEVLPTSMSAATPDVAGMLTCLGCHDGNYAPKAMMKNRVYESLPSTYGTANSIPTLMGGGTSGTGYLDDHPMGLSAHLKCGGENWDCTITNGVVRMNGAMSIQFVANYGFFLQPGSYNNSAVIVCTTCHDPHSMNVVRISNKEYSGLPVGAYATTFFLRAPYNPNDTNPLSNQTAQFCRQCHADKSNEMNGSSARTVF
jgi:hypothetical protein